MRITIAIDGPASSGKGTVARFVAARLGYGYIDTGALYRGVGLHLLRAGQNPRDPEVATPVARELTFRFQWREGSLGVWVNGVDESAAIRGEDVGRAASAVAVHPGVRAALLQTQRDLGAEGGVVMDGRDIGTVVLPDAHLKVYLDASLEERARRRHAEAPGVALDEVRRQLSARDQQDSGRETAPLRVGDDAEYVDTTGRGVEEVVQQVLALAKERGA